MFQVRDLIMRVFRLIFWIFSQFIPDTFQKSPGIATIFANKYLKFFLEYNNIWLFFLSILVFVLCQASANTVVRKNGHKQVVIFSIGFSHIKLVFVLLIKSIAIQIQFLKYNSENQGLGSSFLCFTDAKTRRATA